MTMEIKNRELNSKVADYAKELDNLAKRIESIGYGDVAMVYAEVSTHLKDMLAQF